MSRKVLLLSTVDGIEERLRPILKEVFLDQVLFGGASAPSFIDTKKASYDYFVYCFDFHSQQGSYGFVADMIAECFVDPTKIILYVDSSKGPVHIVDYFCQHFVPNMPVFFVPDLESIGEIVGKGMHLSGEAAILEG